ncbi:galactonolactone dehydrogenase [Chloropicon primus]|nr:galactonolactone dehydrogenase [Chloropicon primus]
MATQAWRRGASSLLGAGGGAARALALWREGGRAGARNPLRGARTLSEAAGAGRATGGGKLKYGTLGALVLVTGYGFAGYGFYDRFRSKEDGEGVGGDGEGIVNWSGTHACTPVKLHEPETLEELEALVKKCHEQGRKLRPVGNALSPNGIALSDHEMVSLAMMDKVLAVNKRKRQVTVQPGCSVGRLCGELRKRGLVLENLASIAEQQVGGFLQIGAHGTGAAIPPVEMQVVEMKVMTPGEGLVTVRRDEDPETFRMLQCGLGMFGVVCEATIQCVRTHKLLEHTFTLSKDQIQKQHADLIKKHKHVRYHWIPYTDDVVVTTCDDYTLWNRLGYGMEKAATYSDEERLNPLRSLLLESGERRPEDLAGLSFADLRTMLLERNSLDVNHIKRVNQAEAEFWKRSEGYRIGYSDEILQFDCGGQQWVLEMAVGAGTLERPSYADVDYVRELLEEIEFREIPAPAPIEQRWTASSQAVLSPASSTDPSSIFSWIGIIMYLPLSDLKARAKVTEGFKAYSSLMRSVLEGLEAQEHWAKIELPSNQEEREDVVKRIARRYPVEKVRQLRSRFDPKNILGSDMLDELFGLL